MKKIFIVLSVIGSLVINSCKKTEVTNPLADINNLGTGAYLTLNSTINLNFNYSALATSAVGIKVDQYAGATAKQVDHIDVFAVKGSSGDPTKWKKVKTVPYSGTTTLSVTGTELATALSVPLSSFSAGDFYTFYNRVYTKDGQWWDISNSNNGALVGLSTYNAAFSFIAYITCPFNAPMGGTFKVIRDDWADWNPGDLVTVTDGPGSNQINISAIWPNPAYGNVVAPLVVNVDQNTGTAKVPKVNFGDYGGGYNMTAQGANGSDVAGYVFSCTGYITLNMNLIANGPGGNGVNFGPNKLILQKQ